MTRVEHGRTFQSALVAVERGDHERAKWLLGFLAEDYPRSVLVQFYYGAELAQTGQIDKAAGVLRPALRLPRADAVFRDWAQECPGVVTQFESLGLKFIEGEVIDGNSHAYPPRPQALTTAIRLGSTKENVYIRCAPRGAQKLRPGPEEAGRRSSTGQLSAGRTAQVAERLQLLPLPRARADPVWQRTARPGFAPTRCGRQRHATRTPSPTSTPAGTSLARTASGGMLATSYSRVHRPAWADHDPEGPAYSRRNSLPGVETDSGSIAPGASPREAFQEAQRTVGRSQSEDPPQAEPRPSPRSVKSRWCALLIGAKLLAAQAVKPSPRILREISHAGPKDAGVVLRSAIGNPKPLRARSSRHGGIRSPRSGRDFRDAGMPDVQCCFCLMEQPAVRTGDETAMIGPMRVAASWATRNGRSIRVDSGRVLHRDRDRHAQRDRHQLLCCHGPDQAHRTVPRSARGPPRPAVTVPRDVPSSRA